MTLSNLLLAIHKNYRRGKAIHDREIGDQPDIFIIPLVISTILVFPVLGAALGLAKVVEWLGGLLSLLALGLFLYGYYTILGFIDY